ncbi:MAG: phenylacetate-CoA oxygenase subunit PaaJ [Nocardiopsaceae bacterium]|nr:phenylacetate-CoA oxygenase subunit PaaJ [Nocardiopsaceae bacterium]
MVTAGRESGGGAGGAPGHLDRDEDRARAVAAAVTDPELPMLTLADLGVLRDVTVLPGVNADGGTVTVSITPTYSGCPALGAMREDLLRALHRAGFEAVEVRTVLSPPWTTDWITAEGRRKLAAAGIAPPGPASPASAVTPGSPVNPAGSAPRHGTGPVPLTLVPPPARVPCPRCGSADTALVSPFGATACKALRRCRACDEPFEHVKEH